jgi:hypothetical protein
MVKLPLLSSVLAPVSVCSPVVIRPAALVEAIGKDNALAVKEVPPPLFGVIVKAVPLDEVPQSAK